MKKYLLPTIVFAVLSLSVYAQPTIALKVNMNTGAGPQRGKFDNAFGLGTQVDFPFKYISALKFTAGFNAGINGFKKIRYTLDFNGSNTDVDVNYTNYLFQLSPGLKYVFREGKAWSPYAAINAGLMSYYTDMA